MNAVRCFAAAASLGCLEEKPAGWISAPTKAGCYVPHTVYPAALFDVISGLTS